MPSNAYPLPAYQPDELTQIIIQTARQERYNSELYLRLAADSVIKSKPDLSVITYQAYRQDWQHYLCLIDHMQSLEKSKKTVIPNKNLALSLPVKNKNISTDSLLIALKNAERMSIIYHEKICSMTLGHDYQTFDLAYSILNENVQHEGILAFYIAENL